MNALRDAAMPAIALAAVALLALQALHSIDHLMIQDRVLEPQVAALGVLESAAVALTLVLALSGHPSAPLASMVAGGFTALAFATVHLLPRWGFLSDPYADASLEPVSWAIMFVGLATSLALMAAGLRRSSGTST